MHIQHRIHRLLNRGRASEKSQVHVRGFEADFPRGRANSRDPIGADHLGGEPLPLVELPTIGTPEGMSGGRSVRDGYRRGWGLQFAGLADKIAADPLFQDALAASSGWSVMTPMKRMNLYLILTQFLSPLTSRNVIEFGTYRGGNVLFMAYVLKHTFPEARVYGLDTFQGMPATDPTRDLHGAGDFGDNSLSALIKRRDELGLSNLVLVKGLFQDTFVTLPSDVHFGLAHIDCDIYDAAKYSQDAVWPRMADGGYIVYDDAETSSCIGATEAAENLMMERRIHSEQVWPHWVFRAHRQ